MTIVSLVAAFGGGVFGSLIGGTTAFVFTGILGLIGVAVSLSGGGDVVLNEIAFGPFFGPHVAFVGGVAAAAYLGRQKTSELKKIGFPPNTDSQQIYADEYENHNIDTDYISSLIDGADATIPLFKTKNSIALIIGGTFGILGHILNYIFANVLMIPIDTIALVVITMGIISRLIFGSSGLTGQYPEGESRFTPVKETLLFNTIWGIGLSAVVGYVVLLLEIETIGFVISATSLIFLYFGLSFPVSHHVTMVAGYAAMTFGNIWMAIVFGVLALISGEITERSVNTYVDTHIDMPGAMIALWSFLILAPFG